MLATPPQVADDLGPADRDLALRLANRDLTLPWWSLHLRGDEVHDGRGGASRLISPIGSFEPLLISAAGEVVAGVWLSPSRHVRHYIVPWVAEWNPILDWLTKRAIPEFAPPAARRRGATIGDEPQLQTTAEASARAELATIDEEYAQRRAHLQRAFDEARVNADEIREDLLFGTGAPLVSAVARVLGDAGIDVIDLDALFGKPVSADLLASWADHRCIVEVKGVSGNAPERLVAAEQKHLDTWPHLRPTEPVTDLVLVLNHQSGTHPLDRSGAAYSRPEFVASLPITVITSVQLFDAWRRADHDTTRKLLFGPTKRESAISGPPPPPRRSHHRLRKTRRRPPPDGS
jgi:hypothetical protein